MRIKEGYFLYESSGHNIVFFKRKGGRDAKGVLRLNSSGVLLWRMLVDGTSAVALAERLRDEFGLSPERATQDTKSFLTSLISAGVVEN